MGSEVPGASSGGRRLVVAEEERVSRFFPSFIRISKFERELLKVKPTFCMPPNLLHAEKIFREINTKSRGERRGRRTGEEVKERKTVSSRFSQTWGRRESG